MKRRSNALYCSSLLTLALAGCSAPGDAVLEPALDGKADNPTEQSHAGRYVTAMVPTLDECGIGFDIDRSEIIELVFDEDGTSFVLETDGNQASCAVDEDGEFECEFPAPHPLLASMKMSLSGGFDGAGGFEAVMTTEIECEGAECEQLETLFEDAELPCTSAGLVLGSRVLAEDFEVEAGDYQITVSEPMADVTTCKSDTLGALPDVVAIETNDEGFTIDDGLGPFECSLVEGGGIECDRLVEVPGLEFASAAAGAFVDSTRAVGALQVDVRCTGDEDECALAEQLFGELPCTAYHTLELSAAE